MKEKYFLKYLLAFGAGFVFGLLLMLKSCGRKNSIGRNDGHHVHTQIDTIYKDTGTVKIRVVPKYIDVPVDTQSILSIYEQYHPNIEIPDSVINDLFRYNTEKSYFIDTTINECELSLTSTIFRNSMSNVVVAISNQRATTIEQSSSITQHRAKFIIGGGVGANFSKNLLMTDISAGISFKGDYIWIVGGGYAVNYGAYYRTGFYIPVGRR